MYSQFMKRSPGRKRPEPDLFLRLPVRFGVGVHQIAVALNADWSWSCSVDGSPLKARFEREAAAWEAGVREASRLDGLHAE